MGLLNHSHAQLLSCFSVLCRLASLLLQGRTINFKFLEELTGLTLRPVKGVTHSTLLPLDSNPQLGGIKEASSSQERSCRVCSLLALLAALEPKHFLNK